MIKVKGSGLVNVGYMLGLLQSFSACAELSRLSPQNFSITLPDAPGTHTINFYAEGESQNQTSGTVKKSIQDVIPDIVQYFDGFQKRCDGLGLTLSSKLAMRITEELRAGPVSLERFGGSAAELATRIEDELSDVLMLRVDNPGLYDALFPFGKEFADKFPVAVEDVQESATCLSLERWTASVFHLMRVVEIGVQKFGDKIGVPLTGEKNWQTILDEINKAIKDLNPKADETKAFASLAAHLYNVKLAWRNEVMHPKATYTPQEAEEIYNHVRTFSAHLVQIIIGPVTASDL